jgi:hypothetical protein
MRDYNGILSSATGNNRNHSTSQVSGDVSEGACEVGAPHDDSQIWTVTTGVHRANWTGMKQYNDTS